MISGTLLPYQQESVGLIDKAPYPGRSLLALDPGLGKTMISNEWFHQKEARFPVLIVSPAAVKFNWPWELNNFFGTRASVCEGQTPPRHNSGFDLPEKVTVINYDILKYWVPYLKGLGIKTLILDECQYLSNIKTQRTKAVKQIAKGVPHVLALSATPLTVRPQELFPVLNILWPREFPAYLTYLTRYCDPKWTPWGMDYSGASNLEELHQRLKTLGMIRFRKGDVLKDLPDKVIRIVPVELWDPDQYHSAKNDFMGWLKQNMTHRVRSAAKAEALTKVGYMLRLTAKLKMKGIVEWANRFLEETDEKLILFAIHHNAIDVMRRRINCKHVVIDGSVTGMHRQNAIDNFQKDPTTRAIFGNLQACGVGTTLTAASEVGICEYPWRPGDLIQAMDRPHRIGQKNTVFINFFAAAGTIEEDMCKILQTRQQNISTILDGGKQGDQLNLHSELLRIIEGTLV